MAVALLIKTREEALEALRRIDNTNYSTLRDWPTTDLFIGRDEHDQAVEYYVRIPASAAHSGDSIEITLNDQVQSADPDEPSTPPRQQRPVHYCVGVVMQKRNDELLYTPFALVNSLGVNSTQQFLCLRSYLDAKPPYLPARICGKACSFVAIRDFGSTATLRLGKSHRKTSIRRLSPEVRSTTTSPESKSTTSNRSHDSGYSTMSSEGEQKASSLSSHLDTLAARLEAPYWPDKYKAFREHGRSAATCGVLVNGQEWTLEWYRPDDWVDPQPEDEEYLSPHDSFLANGDDTSDEDTCESEDVHSNGGNGSLSLTFYRELWQREAQEIPHGHVLILVDCGDQTQYPIIPLARMTPTSEQGTRYMLVMHGFSGELYLIYDFQQTVGGEVYEYGEGILPGERIGRILAEETSYGRLIISQQSNEEENQGAHIKAETYGMNAVEQAQNGFKSQEGNEASKEKQDNRVGKERSGNDGEDAGPSMTPPGVESQSTREQGRPVDQWCFESMGKSGFSVWYAQYEKVQERESLCIRSM